MWSKTKIKTFLECPFRYQLEYINKVESEKKEAIEKGLILHNIFCQYYKFYNGDISETMNITLQKMNISNDFQQIYKNHIK